MTIKEAILRSLEDFPQGATARDVYNNILDKHIMEFSKKAKTPDATVQAQLGDMVKGGDTRLRRFKNENKVYWYYLSKYTANVVQGKDNAEEPQPSAKKEAAVFHERDLHPLLCSFLKSEGIMAKTIYHEKSNKQEEHQKWLHPDIVGAKFVVYNNKTSNSLFNALSKKASLRLYSYELKKEINNDYELKKCFFQAVSNSSWANFGYLVAFDIKETLRDELERLNHSFGIGFILLKANPYESQVWFTAKENQLDFSTIDRLCNINDDFKNFVKLVEATVTASDKYFEPSKKDLQNICDKTFHSDEDIRHYCTTHNIPSTEE